MEIRFDYGTEQRWKINQLAQEQNISVAEATKIFKSQQEECLQKLGLDMGEQPISLGVDQSETNEFTPYTNESAQIPQADEGIGKRINTKDEASVLTFFGLATYSNLREPEKYFEFKKDKNGNITDVYPKNSNDNIFIPDRFSLRYDKDGNLAQSFIQDIDENGNVKGQEITNYNADGTPKNTLYYTYQFDENGNQIGQRRVARDAKYGDAINVLTSIFGCEINEVIQPDGIFEIGAQYDRRSARGISDVKYNQDGKISEIMYNGQRYMLRYDTNGNLSKAIVQGTDDNGTVRMQTVTTIKPDGSKVLQNYTYDENGVENTSDSQKAINKVVELYTTEKRDISKSQNTYNKFKAFIENDTMAKLKAAGVSNESIQALLDNLFGEIIFEDNDYNKALADVYKEQYEKLFHETPQILMKVEGFPSIIK